MGRLCAKQSALDGAPILRSYASFDEMKADEYRYWQSRPAHERLDAAEETIQTAYALWREVSRFFSRAALYEVHRSVHKSRSRKRPDDLRRDLDAAWERRVESLIDPATG